jgi:hypothetical protein
MRIRLAVVLPFLLLASGAIWWGAPQGVAQQGTVACDVTFLPEHPLEMNTVVSDPRTSQFSTPLIKHVIMEKEIYACFETLPEGGRRPLVRDVEVFIEIIQRVQAARTTTVEKRVEEIICDKGNNATTDFYEASCSARDVPLQETPPDIGCLPADRPQPTDPVEMNTVITSRQDTVKTMKVDKEILRCTEPDGTFFAGHFYLFTEIVEQRAGGAPDNIRPTEKKFQAILCLVDTNGRTVRCHHFIPGGVNG